LLRGLDVYPSRDQGSGGLGRDGFGPKILIHLARRFGIGFVVPSVNMPSLERDH
jgi:hypothetical protein